MCGFLWGLIFYLKAVVIISALMLDSRESKVTLLSTYKERWEPLSPSYLLQSVNQKQTIQFSVPTFHLCSSVTARFLPASVPSGTWRSHAAAWRGRSRKKCSSDQSTASHHIYKTRKRKYNTSVLAINSNRSKLWADSSNMDSPFILIQHQVSKNVFAHGVEGLDDFERLGIRESFCTEKSQLYIQLTVSQQQWPKK